MKIAVTGHNGKVGRYVVEAGGIPLVCDITKPRRIRWALRTVKPDVVIHLAAQTNVDVCEYNYKVATAVNLWGTANLRKEYSGPIIYVSTDHVFDGKKGRYTEKTKPSPVNAYGFSKLAGEVALDAYPHELDTIVRTSKIFTTSPGDTFLDILHKLQDGTPFELSAVIFRTFMYGKHFAESLLYLASNLNTMPRKLNISGTEYGSMYDFGLAVASVFDLDKDLITPRKKKLKDMTPRPYKGGLRVTLAKRNGFPMYSYIDGLKELKNDTAG